MKKNILTQFIVLLAGTLFAWTNFGIELADWLGKRACTIGCSADITNPFLTPCFGGAVFFTIAFVLNIIIFRKEKARNN
ncbi:MAG: hypothetical protein V1756_01160 [Patescibacteria group bacterium]